MTRVILKGIAMGAFVGFIFFELMTGLLFFYGLGSGHGVDVAGTFVVTMQPNGGFLLNVGAGYLLGLLCVIALFAVLASSFLLRSYQRESRQSR